MSFIAEILELIKLRCLGRMAVRLAFLTFVKNIFFSKLKDFLSLFSPGPKGSLSCLCCQKVNCQIRKTIYGFSIF